MNGQIHNHTMTGQVFAVIFAAAVALIVMPAHGQSEIEVPTHYGTIQEAIDAATHGDEIIVLPGTYNEAIDFNGKAVHLRSSDGPEVTIIDASGLDTSVVTCASGEGPDTILEGFTITGGTGTLVSFLHRGGGMYNVGSSPTVTNCIFENNEATLGGGMYNVIDSSPTVTNCGFENNEALQGGGMYNSESSPTVTNCVFENNEAGLGGGMHNVSESSPTVTKCVFENNEASFGGGMYNVSESSPTVTNCVFENNSASSLGGGMRNIAQSNPMVTDCDFVGNSASDGGGMANTSSSNPTVLNCSFETNTASDEGGGVWSSSDSTPDIGGTFFCENTPEHIIGPWDNLSGNEFLSQCVVADPPVAICAAFPTEGSDYEIVNGELLVECDGPDGREITLDGSESFDPQDASLTFHWHVPDGIALDYPASAITSGVFPIGTTTAKLTVTNEFDLFDTCDVVIHVQDTTPPEVFITTDKAVLWPPNHTMRGVEVIITATDVCEDPGFSFPLMATVSSNEPDNAQGNGDGDTTGDVHGKDGHTAPVDITDEFDWDPDYGEDGAWIGTIQLRAERAGSGNGRAYTIYVEALDSSMNVGTSSIVVVVPKSQGGGGNGGN